MKPSPIRKYLDSTGTLPEDALLGYIAFTLGADGEHDRDQLIAEFEKRGLDTTFIPPLSRSVDAFKKAIRGQQEIRYAMSPTTEACILFREVASDVPNEKVMRAIMREERTDAKSRLSYDKIGEVTLYRGPRRNGQIVDSGARFNFQLASDVTGAERERLLAVGALVSADFRRYLTTLEGTRVRALILDFMKNALQSVPLKASVHFIPIAHAEKLHAFAEAIGTLHGCRIDLVPLVDLKDQREHILEALQADTESTLGDLVADLNKARSGNTTPKVYAQLRGRYDAIMARSQHYADLLDSSMERTIGANDVAKAMLTQLSREFIYKKEAS